MFNTFKTVFLNFINKITNIQNHRNLAGELTYQEKSIKNYSNQLSIQFIQIKTSVCGLKYISNDRYITDYPSTCTMLKTDEPETSSGYYTIQSNKNEAPFTVFCNMTDKNGIGVTVFNHDSEERTHVSGYEGKGEYKKVVTYKDLTMDQIVNVINSSSYCEQFITWYCKGAGFYFHYQSSPDSWWVSRQGYQMKYWGGAIPGSKKCACGMTNTCLDPTRACNCDDGLGQWAEDRGFLRDKEYLPVSALRFGDTGASSEEGYHTLGKLLCWD